MVFVVLTRRLATMASMARITGAQRRMMSSVVSCQQAETVVLETARALSDM